VLLDWRGGRYGAEQMTAYGIPACSRAPWDRLEGRSLGLFWAARGSWLRIPDVLPLWTESAFNQWMLRPDERQTVNAELRIEEGGIQNVQGGLAVP